MYMGLKQPFSQSLGFSRILVIKHIFPPRMFYTSQVIRFPFALWQSKILEINRNDFKWFEVNSMHSVDTLNIGKQISVQHSHS